MSMRRLIGISLACLVTSACAIEKTPEESTSHPPDDPARFPQANGETPTGKSPGSAEGLHRQPWVRRQWLRPGGAAVRRFRARSRWARRHPRALLPRVAHDWNHSVWESCLVQLCGQADRQWRDPRHRYRHRSASFASTRLLREGDEPRQRPLRRRQNQRPGSIHSRTHPRSLAACCRRTRYETRRGGGSCC